MTIRMISDPAQKKCIAAEILDDLPEWFGIPESKAAYILESADLTMIAAFDDEEAAGFMTMKETSPMTVEIHVCGAKKRFHRKGIGSAMFEVWRQEAIRCGYQYAQVKTVAAGCWPEYDATRMFYEKLGFCALEVFPTLWDEANPCLIMVMKL